MDVAEVGTYQALFQCGVDFEKRRIVVMVGAHLEPIWRCVRVTPSGSWAERERELELPLAVCFTTRPRHVPGTAGPLHPKLTGSASSAHTARRANTSS
jgi:hypothetical protein